MRHTGSAKIEAPVAVYVSLPLTGPRGVEGREAADGARLALEQAQGKAGSLQVRAHFLDDARGKPWDPVAVGVNARTAVQDHTTAGYIGELDSEPTRSSAPITNQAGIVQVSPGAGAVDLTGPAAGYPDSPDRYRPAGRRQLRPDGPIRRGGRRCRGRLGGGAGRHRRRGHLGRLAVPEPGRDGVQVGRRRHGIRVSPGKPPGEVAVAPGGGTEPSTSPARARLTVYEGTTQTLRLSAELDPKLLPDKDVRFPLPSGSTAMPVPPPPTAMRRWR